METGTKWSEIVNEFWIKQTTTEPYSPWQNDAEREIQEIKDWSNKLMDAKGIPDPLWDMTSVYIG